MVQNNQHWNQNKLRQNENLNCKTPFSGHQSTSVREYIHNWITTENKLKLEIFLICHLFSLFH